MSARAPPACAHWNIDGGPRGIGAAERLASWEVRFKVPFLPQVAQFPQTPVEMFEDAPCRDRRGTCPDVMWSRLLLCVGVRVAVGGKAL